MTILERLIAADIWIMRNILRGKPNETISSASYNGERTGKIIGKLARPVIDILFLPWMQEHCRKDWEFRKDIYK